MWRKKNVSLGSLEVSSPDATMFSSQPLTPSLAIQRAWSPIARPIVSTNSTSDHLFTRTEAGETAPIVCRDS